ncbi:MAG: hypothetical protein ACREBR_00685 [bacterium]
MEIEQEYTADDETENTDNDEDSCVDGPSQTQLERNILKPEILVCDNDTPPRRNLNPRSNSHKRPASASTSPPSPSCKRVRKASRPK